MTTESIAQAAFTDAALHSAYRVARARWPGITIAVEKIAASMRTIEVDDDRLAKRGDDLVLAHAAALGDDAAARVFENDVLLATRRIIGRYTSDAARTSEVLQRLRIQLLVAEGGEPCRLARYDGRASLAAWIGMCATRMSLYFLRGERNQREVATEWSDALAEIPASDPGVESLRVKEGAKVSEVLRTACLDLTRRQRAILGLLFVQGASVDEIAGVYQVHRVTMWKWIQAAQSQMRDRVRELLSGMSTGAEDQSLSSLIAWVSAQVELSMSGLLTPTATDIRG